MFGVEVGVGVLTVKLPLLGGAGGVVCVLESFVSEGVGVGDGVTEGLSSGAGGVDPDGDAEGEDVGVAVGEGVEECVGVGDGVTEGVIEGVIEGVGDGEACPLGGVSVGLGDGVPLDVGVAVGVGEVVGADVKISVELGYGVGVTVGVGEALGCSLSSIGELFSYSRSALMTTFCSEAFSVLISWLLFSDANAPVATNDRATAPTNAFKAAFFPRSKNN